MNSAERRNRIIERLGQSAAPISASCFAKEFAVTRQIIVADIALLRATGYSIVADNKGYVLNVFDEKNVKRIAVKHDKSQVLSELYAGITTLTRGISDKVLSQKFSSLYIVPQINPTVN